MADNDLWEKLVDGIKPLDKKRASPPPAPAPKKVRIKPPKTSPEPPHTAIVPPKQRGSDGHTRRKLSRGQMPIDARIDLHGMGMNQAHDALAMFIQTAARQGHRNVLVITGKGKENKGILRVHVPKWLREARYNDLVLDIAEAHIKHGGAGAFYVILRRS